MSLFYSFGLDHTEGRAEQAAELGGKGANLAEMCRLGLPVPPGFTISTEACLLARAGQLPADFERQLGARVRRLEGQIGREFGAFEDPLLLSVRSGARVSMPGMMDTVLDLGLTASRVEALAQDPARARFWRDCFRRLVQMYGGVVLGVPDEGFEQILDEARARAGVATDAGLDADQLAEVTARFQDHVQETCGAGLPDDPEQQLRDAVHAVFRSWDNPRARHYRSRNGIPEGWGTAVNVQAMVYGNRSARSASGVAFTRDPATGAPGLVGEYLDQAQGEDVVAGVRTPIPLARERGGDEAFEARFPEAHAELLEVGRALEDRFLDMQDLEFTVEDEVLWVLQTRAGKRTGRAALRIAMDLVDEGRLSPPDALRRVDPACVEQALHPTLAPGQDLTACARGLPASPGVASGRVVRTSDEAIRQAASGPVVLVRDATDPDDLRGLEAAQGILTRTGGATSHAAVVGRGMGKPCVVGCGALRLEDGGLHLGDARVEDGDWITLDGSTGEVYLGQAEVVPGDLEEPARRLLALADEVRVLGVKANADTPADARRARQMGAEGIGLCRTEHMFFAPDRLPIMRRLVGALDDDATRAECLAALRAHQAQDFEGLLREMDGLPVTIRLLDPPLHEFAPEGPAGEANPMLGHRGVRLGLTHPDIYAMQVDALTEAVGRLLREGLDPRPRVMIPLVSLAPELEHARAQLSARIAEAAAAWPRPCEVPLGTMIETPRACLVAATLARHADFFSFGTNDLTQMTFGLSRDDAGSFLPEYLDRGRLPDDPFRRLDIEGVGQLVTRTLREGRRVRPDLEVGVCGEHGGDPASVAFFHLAGLDQVSCSPYRVPTARLAAARAALDHPARGRGPARRSTDPVPALVVATDLGEAAAETLPYARLLARTLGYRIHLLHVVDLAPVPGEFHPYFRGTTFLAEDFLRTARAHLEVARHRHLEGPEPVELAVQLGKPAPTILAYVRQVDAQLLVVTARQRGALERWMTTSVTEGALRGAPCPVLVVPGKSRVPGRGP